MHSHTSHSYSHEHLSALPARRQESRARAVAAITVAMMVLELVVGTLSRSLALTADGWHMASHAGALGLSALAYWFARTRAGSNWFSFGTGKVYALAGYTNAVALLLVALWMIAEAVGRFVRPAAVRFEEALPVAALGLAVNLVCAWILRDDHHHDHDHDHHHDHHDHHDHDHHDHDHDHAEAKDHNLEGAYLHVIADALTSVLAIAALAGGRYLGWRWLDPAVAVLGSVMILRWGVGLCRSSARQLLDASAPHEDLRAVRARIEAIDDARVADLHLWELAPGQRGCVVTVVSSAPRDAAHYVEAVRAATRVGHLTVQVERCDGPHEDAR